MTIWILALILLAGCVALGHKMGAIRAAISFIGIIISASLAVPLSGFIRPLLPHLGFHDPVYLWALPPAIVFVILMIIVKSIGQFVHFKVYVHYKHYTDDLQMAWWERLNHRVGLCIGTLNALTYLVLISFAIYIFSYWTVQIASSSQEKFPVTLLNRAGRDLEATDMIKVAAAVNATSPLYFKLADFAGLLYQNPQLADRLADYPPFLSIDQRPEFHSLGGDAGFQGDWKNHAAIGQLLQSGAAKAIWLDKNKANLVWNMVVTNLSDLQNYLQTGQSAKYNDPIFGRWHFNVVSTIAMLSQTRQNFSSADMKALRALWTPAYAQTEFIASADGQAFLKNFPHFQPPQPKQPPQFDAINYAGSWTGADGSYQITLASDNDKKSGFGKIGGTRLTLTLNGDVMIFDR